MYDISHRNLNIQCRADPVYLILNVFLNIESRKKYNFKEAFSFFYVSFPLFFFAPSYSYFFFFFNFFFFDKNF